MLDLALMDRIALREKPIAQWCLAYLFLMPQFKGRPGVRIRFEGYENVPDEPVIFAMNHTDYYTFFPFMYELILRSKRYTSAWVKGKNYDHPAMARFMEVTNNLPVPSRGYFLARDFVDTVGRKPTGEEYDALRRWVDEGRTPDIALPDALVATRRDVFGRSFDPARETYAEAIDGLMAEMMRRFVKLNGDAFERGNDLLIFPQGTRSIRLSRGHIGLAQMALHYRKTIVPVGANNLDRIYPGGSIMAKGGDITYRFGAPIRYEDLEEFHVEGGFEPFSREAEEQHRDRFQGLVDRVMDALNELLDERHQYTPDRRSDGLTGADRFV